MTDKNIIITGRAVLLFFLVAIGLVVLWMIKSVLILFFFSLVLALALEPTVLWLNSRKVPYGISIFLVVIFVALSIISLSSIAIVPFIQQIQVLIRNLPRYFEALIDILGLGHYTQSVSQTLFTHAGQASGGVISFTIGAFSGIFAVITIIIFVVYILLDFKNLRGLFVSIFPKEEREAVKALVSRVEGKLGGWLRGQVILMFVVGFTTYIGLVILGVDYALALAVIAGLFEIVPIIGPIVSIVPAAMVGFSMSTVTGFGTLGLYVLVQQLENHFIVPKVMNKMIGFNPLVTIIALMIGGKLMGLIGVILAIPVTIILIEIIQYVLRIDFSHFTKSPRTAG